MKLRNRSSNRNLNPTEVAHPPTLIDSDSWPHPMKITSGIATCATLWAIAGAFFGLAASSQIPGVAEAVKVADIAREKDVVWLSLVTTIVAIVYSGWIGYRKDKQSEATTNALLETAKAVQQLSAAVIELRKDIESRKFESNH